MVLKYGFIVVCSSCAEYADKLIPDPFLDEAPVSSGETVKSSEEGEARMSQVFSQIQHQITPEIVNSVQAVYVFKVKGSILFLHFLLKI